MTHIQDLTEIDPKRVQYWLRPVEVPSGDNVMYSMHSECYYGSFLNATLLAYNNHLKLRWSPDDIWLIIMQYYSGLVNADAGTYRQYLVDHKDKMKLTVVQDTDKPDWRSFFLAMLEQIKQNTKPDVTDTMVGQFSTSTVDNMVISSAAIMSAVKSFFDYGFTITCCGITDVDLLGTVEDWILIRTKLVKMLDFGMPKSYVDNLVPIIDKLIDTKRGIVDVKFWNDIVHTGGGGSGVSQYFTGWILKFYGKDKSFEELQPPELTCPVHFVNHNTSENFMVEVKCGHAGFTFSDDKYVAMTQYLTVTRGEG